VTVTSDAARLDVNVDYGNAVGYFVRIDVDLPRDSLYPTPGDRAAVSGWLALTPDEAETFAERLMTVGRRTRNHENSARGTTGTKVSRRSGLGWMAPHPT
jgi:hypothetical protein